MKLPFTIYDLRFTICRKSGRAVGPLADGGAHGVTRPTVINHQSSIINHKSQRGFTMVEIAISLAIIGIALVGILVALPRGMQIQRDNREQTVINQDATVFMEAIRGGAQGADDLTNYVFMITNTYAHFAYSNFTSGAQIVGLLSTPEYVDAFYQPATPANYASSNRMVAFVHSMSGPAVEKPPQPNGSLIRESSFSYGLICENLPVAHYIPPFWTAKTYFVGDNVSYLLNGQTTYWVANVTTTDVPTNSVNWTRINYPQELDNNLHELRLTFLWSLLPDSQPPRVHYGTGHQTFRAMIAGQLVLATNTVPGGNLYYFQSQSFTNAP